ncbi:MAG: nucleoside deaminase [Clostridia bacterium]|nr:nucleoside deaminase [Clostridia bacterium]
MVNKKYMNDALLLAKEAFDNGEIPVGAVIVKDGKIISSGRNRREEKKNALSHAEIEAINSACKALESWRLDGCEIYVTLEPCPMCMGAILDSRIDTLVFGAFDLDGGCADSVLRLQDHINSSKLSVFGGICEEECKKLIVDFFGVVRNRE